MEITNTTLLYGLFNQYCFSEAKMNIKYLKMYYNNNHMLYNNTLVTRILQLIESYDLSDLTEAKIILTLEEDGKTAAESTAIYNKISEFKSYTKEQASVFVDNLREICNKAYVDKMQSLYANEPVKFVNGVKNFEYKSNYSDKLQAKTFGELDITDLVNRYSGNGYKSRYKFINDSYSCGGYIPGQLVVVTGAPSVGKSLFMQSEAVNFMKQGQRIHYLAMGDLNELDVAVRMMCQMSGKSQRQVESDIIGNYKKYKDKFSDYLSITVVPSGTIYAEEYVDWILQRKNEYDILMVDYYSNFAEDENRSMYQTGGDRCDQLTRLTREGKLVFLGAQPNKSYYGEEFLPYEAIGESSRIAHIADMIITIGRNWESGMRMGMFNIAKNRKGLQEAETTQEWIGTSDGLFYPCSKVLYSRYRADKRKYSLTYRELEMMDIIGESIRDQVPKDIKE